MATIMEGRKVVVCGGSRGIGRSIALAFAAAGAHVSICARSAGALAATKNDLSAAGHGIMHAAACDLSTASDIAAYVPAAAAALGGIDVLVNNASGFGMGDTEQGWAQSLSVDVLATVRASQAAQPFLLKGSLPAIVNITSISGFRPSVRTSAYGAAKAAIMHYTTSQAGSAGAAGRAGQFRGAGLDRVSGRYMGRAQDICARAVCQYSEKHSVRAARLPRRGGRCCAISGVAPGTLGHWASHCRRWRTIAGRVGFNLVMPPA